MGILMVLGKQGLLLLAILFPVAWVAAWAVMASVPRLREVKLRWLWSLVAAMLVCVVFAVGKNVAATSAVAHQPMNQPNTQWVSEDGKMVLTVSDSRDGKWYRHTLTFTLAGQAMEGNFHLDIEDKLVLDGRLAGEEVTAAVVRCRSSMGIGGDRFTLRPDYFSADSKATNDFFAGRNKIVFLRQGTE